MQEVPIAGAGSHKIGLTKQTISTSNLCNSLTPPTTPPVAPPKENSGSNATLVKRFWKLQPPSFEGGLDPLVAEDWIAATERIFNLIDCLDPRKVLALHICYNMAQGIGGILLPDPDPKDMCGPGISSRNFFLKSITPLTFITGRKQSSSY